MSQPRFTSLRRRAAALALAAFALGGVPSAMANGSGRTVQSGWWWAAQASPAFPLPVPYGTEPGDLLVSRHAGAQEKAAAVLLDVSDLSNAPASMVVELSEIRSDVALPASGGLLACPVINTPWEPVQGGAWPKRPAPNCISTDMAIGTRSPEGTWSFDLTKMAGSWAAGALPNLGFAIVPGQSLRYPSFEIALRAPGIDQVTVLPGAPIVPSAPTSPTPAPAAPPTVEASPAPSAWTRPVRSGDTALPRTAATAAAPAPAPVPAQPASAAPSDSSDARMALVGTVVHRPVESNDLPVQLGLAGVVGAVWAAFAISKRRSASAS